MATKIFGDFRRFFFRGLGAVLPTLLTIAIVLFLFGKLQEWVGVYINSSIKWLWQMGITLFHKFYSVPGAPDAHQQVEHYWQTYHLSWIGFVVAFIGIYILGRFVGSYLGRSVLKWLDQALLRVPIIKQIYPHVRQMTDFIFSEKRMQFSRVVAVEYPRKGIWSLGFVTGPGFKSPADPTGQGLITVFVPASPPLSGFTMMVRREETMDLSITADEALRFIISCGVIAPGHNIGSPVAQALPDNKEV